MCCRPGWNKRPSVFSARVRGEASADVDRSTERRNAPARHKDWIAVSALSVCARKSGEVRGTPVSIVTIDGNRYIVAAFSGAAWVHNVRASGSGTVGRGRNVERVRLVELPIEERGPVLRAFLQQVRGGVRFFGAGDPDVVAAGADRYPVFRLDPS